MALCLVALGNLAYLSGFQFPYFYLFIYFWLPWAFVAELFSSCGEVSRGYSLVAVHELLIAVASLGAERGLSSCGFWTLEHRLSSCDMGLVAPCCVGSSCTRD